MLMTLAVKPMFCHAEIVISYLDGYDFNFCSLSEDREESRIVQNSFVTANYWCAIVFTPPFSLQTEFLQDLWGHVSLSYCVISSVTCLIVALSSVVRNGC